MRKAKDYTKLTEHQLIDEIALCTWILKTNPDDLDNRRNMLLLNRQLQIVKIRKTFRLIQGGKKAS